MPTSATYPFSSSILDSRLPSLLSLAASLSLVALLFELIRIDGTRFFLPSSVMVGKEETERLCPE